MYASLDHIDQQEREREREKAKREQEIKKKAVAKKERISRRKLHGIRASMRDALADVVSDCWLQNTREQKTKKKDSCIIIPLLIQRIICINAPRLFLSFFFFFSRHSVPVLCGCAAYSEAPLYWDKTVAKEKGNNKTKHEYKCNTASWVDQPP